MEIEFSTELVRLLRHFNLIEFNLGLALSRLICPNNPTSAYKKLANMSAEQKLKEFRRLTKDRGIVKKDRSAPTLDKWIERAHGARGVRNIYIHGHWSLLLPTAERPVTLHAPPWMSKNLGLDSPIEMTLSELHDMADNMESLSNDFIKLKNTLGV